MCIHADDVMDVSLLKRAKIFYYACDPGKSHFNLKV
jgi:hypothetical protein